MLLFVERGNVTAPPFLPRRNIHLFQFIRMFHYFLDSFHMNTEEQFLEETIRKYQKVITHFHIADSDRWPPGHGHLKVENHLTLLGELGYDGWISAETLPKPDNEEALIQTARFLKRHNFLRGS